LERCGSNYSVIRVNRPHAIAGIAVIAVIAVIAENAVTAVIREAS
jgi:hypothetical protein